MFGKTYVTKGYSTYTDIPAARSGYDQGQKNPNNRYVVESNKIEQIRTPVGGYSNFGGSPSKIELLKEYVHSPTMSSGPKHQSTNHYQGYEPNYGLNYVNSSPPKSHKEVSWPMKTSNFSSPDKYRASSPPKFHKEASGGPMDTSYFSSPNKHRPSSPVHGYHSEETRVVHSGPALDRTGYVRTGNFSGPNKSWQTAGPPATHHPLTNPTNNINEALGFLEESVNHSTRLDTRRRGGVLDELSTRAQPVEPQRRYARPAFVAKPNDAYRKRY